MPSNASGTGAVAPTVPSTLDLVRLSPRRLFPPGGEDLYRQIALLTDMEEGQEVLDVACGKGVSLEYFVRRCGVHGAGVDADGRLIDAAEAHARQADLSSRIQFQTGEPDRLPYRDEIFDVVVGEMGLAAQADPAAAVRELSRVCRPGGRVALVQLVWKAPVEAARQRVLAAHLGARPLMLVEWRRHLKDAGVVEVHTEDWSDEESSLRAKVVKPFPDFAEIFSVPEKVGILRRAWSRWGWVGVRTVLEREREVHRLLTRERILGLNLMTGRKAAAEPEPVPAGVAGREVAGDGARDVPKGRRSAVGGRPRDEGGGAETAGLPLFGAGDERDEN
jgi:SAM-dependent methyltransferase